MARKGQVSIQDTLETNEDFDAYLQSNHNRLICMEVYSDFCGPCLAVQNAVRKGKLEIGGDSIAMAKAVNDKICALSRFRGKSEPAFLFISKGKLTRAMFGANGIELCRIITEELAHTKVELETGVERPKQDVEQMLPEEAVKLEDNLRIEQEYREATERLRVLTLAARKKRICERASRQLRHLNFILFWPHCHQAHYDLYEKWDRYNVSVAAKETIQLTEESVKEALYMSDVDPNEACLYALMKDEALVVLFKVMESDTRDFIKLMRFALYEEIPVPKEDVPPEKQVPPIPAYERYASISKTAREVRRERYEAKLQKLREEKEEADRLAAEQARLEREAEEERQRQEKQRLEEERFARIQAGLPAEPEPIEDVQEEEIEGEQEKEGEEKYETETEATATVMMEDVEGIELIEEEAEKVEEEFHSDVEVEGEDYIPPGGLFVPGLYSPANELSRANGLAHFFPKIVKQLTAIESEHLPPHALVMFTVDKRHDVQEIMAAYGDEMLAYGIFVGDDPYSAEHVAYTIKQYDKMERLRRHKDRIAVMVSRKRSLPLLQLAGLNPLYISSSTESGERDCLAMFPVGYGDEYEDEEEGDVQITETSPDPDPETPTEITEEPRSVDEEVKDDEVNN